MFQEFRDARSAKKVRLCILNQFSPQNKSKLGLALRYTNMLCGLITSFFDYASILRKQRQPNYRKTMIFLAKFSILLRKLAE